MRRMNRTGYRGTEGQQLWIGPDFTRECFRMIPIALYIGFASDLSRQVSEPEDAVYKGMDNKGGFGQ
jgi:hypothetical protein